MNTPITTDIIARLRELIAAATALDRIVGGRVLHAIFLQSADDAKAIVTAKAKAQDAVAGALIALPAILDQLAAQAAEIERLKKDWTFLLGLSKEGARIAGCALVERDEARTRVAELSALIRSIYSQDVEDDQQSPVEDPLRHLAGEYGKARCRVRELERELAGLAEGWDFDAENTEPSTEYADRIDALRECAASLRAVLAKRDGGR